MRASAANNFSHRLVLFSLSFVFCIGLCAAQSLSTNAQPLAGDYTVVQMGPHSRIWQNSYGQSVTEIATGMNYWDGQQWTPSNPQFVASPDGTAFVASQIQDPTRLADDINCVGAVTVTTPDNVTLRSTPIAIGLYDTTSGLSAIVATLTNSTGALVDAQDVVYNRALVGGGFAASVVYSLPNAGAFHQDVVFVGFDAGFNPTNWGFAESSTNTLQIQIITEFYEPPQPLMLTNYVFVEQDPATRAAMASPDLIDYTLDFGDYVFGPGRAYTQTANSGVKVLKNLVTLDGRTFLIESVPYLSLAAGLYALPPVTIKSSSLNDPHQKATRTRLVAASLPSRPPTKPVERLVPSNALALTGHKPQGIDVDYEVTVSSTVEPTVYSSDTTYFVSGNVTCSSPTTMENAVFKFPTNNIGAIIVNSTLTMATTNYRTAIFTGADDNSAGTTLSTLIWAGYTGNPSGKYYGDIALSFDTSASIALNNLRFCYMNCAIQTIPPEASFVLSDLQLSDCITGIALAGTGHDSTYNLNNCLMAGVQDPFTFGSTHLSVVAYNCTVDSCLYLVNGVTGVFNFTNSIFSNIASNGMGSFTLTGGYNGFYNCVPFGSHQFTNTASPYQLVGAGNYYLTSASSFQTNGTTNAGSSLRAQLAMKTTEAPLILTNVLTSDTTLVPVAQRDTNGTALGWHYDPLDYLSACAVTNASLFLVDGVAMGYYDNLGIWLQDNSQLVSQGTPNSRNFLAYYGLVQEQPVSLWGVSNALAQSLPIAAKPFGSSGNPSIFLRLTTICVPQGETNLLNTGDTGQVISGLTLQDCEVYGAGANWLMRESNNTPLVGLTNNVFHRVPFAVSNNATIRSYNNLFYGTTNSPGSVTNTIVSIRHRSGLSSPNTNDNNVFDGVTVSLDGAYGYNAYLHGATNSNASTNNTDRYTNLTWQAGPLGAFYQGTNSPLLTNGSTSATNLGLYYYTVMTNDGLEGTNFVSRGYHYVAVSTNGQPLTNGQTIPDYLEGTTSTGISNSWLMEYFGTLDVNSNAVYNANGDTVLGAYEQGADPNVINFAPNTTNQHVRVSAASVQTQVTMGMPIFMAALVDSTNFANAVWEPYNPNLTANLGTAQGWHTIFVGLRGLPANATQTWQSLFMNLDQTAPVLTVTNPIPGVVTAPMIQIQGYASEELSSVSYSLSNANGSMSNQTAFVTTREFNTNVFDFSTNGFQCFNVPLASGTNAIAILATDLAGNISTTNLVYVLNANANTNPPVMNLIWPQNGAYISGTNFTIRGTLSDPFATISAQAGSTNFIWGEIEQNHAFWIENVALGSGSNSIKISATNAAGYGFMTNITVFQSPVNLEVTGAIPNFYGSAALVSGTVNPTNSTVYVNGVEATNNGDGTWTGYYVPSSENSTLTYSVSTQSNGNPGSNNPQTEFNMAGPVGTLGVSYHHKTGIGSGNNVTYASINWQLTAPGSGSSSGPGYSCVNTWGSDDVVSGQLCAWDPNYCPLTWECANVGQVGAWNSYYAQTGVTLFTGGKSDSAQETVWVVTMAAVNESFNSLLGPPPGLGIPPNQIVVAGQSQDPNNNTYFVLPNNSSVDVTPRAPSVAYAFGWDDFGNLIYPPMAATACVPQIFANGIALDPIKTNATFCVGQQITFTMAFSPPLPFVLSNVVYNWTFPGNYVNSVSTNSAGCAVYSINASLWETSSPTNWYYNGPGGIVSLGANIITPNGKSLSVASVGKFAIVKPTIIGFSTNYPLVTATFSTNDGVSASAQCVFQTEVLTPHGFPGTFTYGQMVQLSAAYYTATLFGASPHSISTGGAFWLDNNYPYADDPVNISGTNAAWVLHSDSPNLAQGSSVFTNSVSIADQFKTYLIFQPTGGIYVGIGEIDWGWSCNATENNGIWTWTTTTNQPTTNWSYSGFPFWTNILINN